LASFKQCKVQTVSTFALIIQAIVLVYWYVKAKNKPTWWAGIITTLTMMVPLISQIMVYVGAFDIVVDFRKIRKDYSQTNKATESKALSEKKKKNK